MDVNLKTHTMVAELHHIGLLDSNVCRKLLMCLIVLLGKLKYVEGAGFGQDRKSVV